MLSFNWLQIIFLAKQNLCFDGSWLCFHLNVRGIQTLNFTCIYFLKNQYSGLDLILIADFMHQSTLR